MKEGEQPVDIQKAKEAVIQAGHQLVASSLIARTWGNVSCRIDDAHFAITPSGRPYATLKPEDIVLVSIADLSYDGTVRPSSEKGIHAAAYKLRPAVNFVIHTHQHAASMASIAKEHTVVEVAGGNPLFGCPIPIARYALPGTGKLRNHVATAIAGSSSKAILMANHGALCLGADYGEAFAIATELEQVCTEFLLARCARLSGKTVDGFSDITRCFLASRQVDGVVPPIQNSCHSLCIGGEILFFEQGQETRYRLRVDGQVGEENFPYMVELHRQIYASRPEVRCIVHTLDAATVAVSQTRRTVYAWLDDFAQIVGTSVHTVGGNRTDRGAVLRVIRALQGRNAVLLENQGALCCAQTEEDAVAISDILCKNCKTYIVSALFPKARPINTMEAHLMRLVYRKKYARMALK